MGHVPPLSVDSGGGHSNSPLFTSLPVEIRLQIYDEVFTGSKLTLVITPSRHSRDPVPLGGRRTIFESTGHHNFLLTCRVVYHEALSSYWSKTLVVCGTSERLANFLGLETGDLFHLTYVANRMSDFAKAHIKHLREVEPFKDPVYQDTHDLPFREFISLFPQLETCEIRSDYSSAMTSEMMEEDESCVVEAIDRTTYRHKRAGLCLSAGCNPPKRPFTPRVLGRKILFSRNSVSSIKTKHKSASSAYLGMVGSSLNAEKLTYYYTNRVLCEWLSLTTRFIPFD